MLSDIVDEAVGSVGYHLTKLVEHGFVHEAPGDQGKGSLIRQACES